MMKCNSLFHKSGQIFDKICVFVGIKNFLRYFIKFFFFFLCKTFSYNISGFSSK